MTSGKTYLQLVNIVLARMRESSVATVSETIYSTYIGTLLNQVKAEIEQAYYWNALRDTYAINTVASTTSYAFTGAGPAAVVMGDGWDTTSPGDVRRGTNYQFNQWYFGTVSANIPTGPVTHFIPAGIDANLDLKIDVYPIPDAVYALKFNLYVPQADLSDASDVCYIPQDVLIEETIARAMVERGDDASPKPAPGETFILTNLLAQAVAREAGHDDEEMDWVPN